MTWGALWESVAALRRVEFVTLLITLIVPLLSGTVLLTLRQSIKTLQSDSSQNQISFYEERVGRLERQNHTFALELQQARGHINTLQTAVAPRQISPYQTDLLLDRLRGVKAAPVLVAAYAFEEESALYAADIAAVLRKAHWDVSLNKASMNDFKGISLTKIDLMHQPVAGLRELSDALTEAKIDVRPREIKPDSIAGSLQDGTLLIVVGRK